MNEKAPNAKPIARKEGLVIQELPDEVLVYDLDSDRAHCLNQTAAFVWQNCDGSNSPTEIANTLGKEFKCAADEKIVWLALDQLASNNLLQAKPIPPAALAGMNRRTMVRALGLAAVVAVPLVTSIVAPTPAQAASCKPNGAGCETGSECCSTICSGSTCGAP